MVYYFRNPWKELLHIPTGKHLQMVSCWFGLVVWDSKGALENPGALGIQTTNPNQQLILADNMYQIKNHI